MGLEEFGDQNCRDPKTRPPRTGQLIERCEGKSDELCMSKEDMRLRRTQWSIVGPGTYVASSLSSKTLAPGVYVFKQSEIGILFIENPTKSDDLINFPDSVFENVEKEVDNFWQLGDNFKQYGFLHRRGYLFYGTAGSGKSCLVQRIIRNVIEKDGLVFICTCNPKVSSDALKILMQ